ncbi:hypothetical protein VRK_17460 [Vibrio sp. MEBiC08052]|nr:hypothetical protein VRK_17460 [Vibrio sp. MEBiC08052]
MCCKKHWRHIVKNHAMLFCNLMIKLRFVESLGTEVSLALTLLFYRLKE